MRFFAVLLFASSLTIVACAEREPTDDANNMGDPVTKVERSVDTTIKEYLRAEYPDVEALTYRMGGADLNNDGTQEYLVYVKAPSLCKSAGCSLLVLQSEEDGLREIGNLAGVNLPAGVVTTASNGFKDLGVTVIGGAGLNTGTVRVSFDGRAYSETPTINSASSVGALDIVTIAKGVAEPVG